MSDINFHDKRVKKLSRSQDGRIIAGVCSGIGRYVNVDPNIVRIALAATVFFGGLGVGIYAVGWLLLPDEARGGSIFQDMVEKHQNGTAPWQQATAPSDPPRYDTPEQFHSTGAYGTAQPNGAANPNHYAGPAATLRTDDHGRSGAA
ncbi:PspC domain-containing protein [Sinosporangium siamense]|nr:PspC domain-containing protein [Sinosporangium siamense]